MRPHRDGAARPGMLLGALLVLLGVLFLLQNFGLFEVEEIWQYWPVILIALGIARISHCQGEHGKILGGLFVVIGAAILADNLGLLRWFHIQRFWPLLLSKKAGTPSSRLNSRQLGASSKTIAGQQ